MGKKELTTALRQQGEAHARECWAAAEEAVARRRKEIARKLSSLQEEADRRLRQRIEALRSNLLLEARSRSMACRLHAEAELGARLRCLADAQLPELAGARRSELWARLREELPRASWQDIRVVAADRELAAKDFPQAGLDVDEGLGGGMVVSAENGAVQIDNSLRCRLERAWPELLPVLLGTLRGMVDKDATAGADSPV